ncbi:GNAT family N-acetyltransferase [Maribellus sediminis]|uniref:GNAT family N-acetyltransferase n=1 Tax=Maribellus sediminis TaxID=2696285 RepID=UPI001431A1DD|nr:GNAT family N-acetyltransferase [Maribellus sediminis]
MQEIKISQMNDENWPEVTGIYEAGIATKNATFQTEVPEWETWDSSHRKDCRLIAKHGEQVVGWAALSNVSSRCVYAGVAEVSIYVDPDYSGKGVGSKLMAALIEASEANGIWTLQAGIFPENTGSIRLHQKFGFRILGVKERIGKMDGVWRNVVSLERRSKVVGID